MNAILFNLPNLFTMKYIYIFIIILFCNHNISAQVVKGRICNLDNLKPVMNCSIEITKSDSSLVTHIKSDSLGHFTFDKLEKDNKYIIKVSHKDYNQLTSNFTYTTEKVKDIGDLYIDPLISLTIDEVVVKGDRVTLKDNGLAIIPSKDQLQLSNSGYDLIHNLMIPGVDVDRFNGSITKLGQNVAIYIDGRKVEPKEFQAINMNSIRKIEFMDVPSGKFVGDVYAINIILKNGIEGSYFSLDGKQGLRYLDGDYNGTFQINKKRTSYQLFAGHSMTRMNNKGSLLSEQYGLSNQKVTRESETIDDLSKNNNQYFQLNISGKTQKRSLQAKIAFFNTTSPDNRISNKIKYSNNYLPNSTSNSVTDNKMYRPSVELYGDFILPKSQNISLMLASSYSRNNYSRTYEEDKFSFQTASNEDIYNAIMNFNYNRQIKGHMISLSMLDNFLHSNARYSGSTSYKQQLYTNESILNLGYMYSFNQKMMMNIKFGASILSYKPTDNKQINQISPRANVMLRYMPKQQHAFSLLFNVGNSYPTISTLNSVEQVINPMLILKGNPKLDIATLYNGALMYNFQNRKIAIQAMTIANIYNNTILPYYYERDHKIVNSYTTNSDMNQFIGVLFTTINATESISLKSELAILHNRFNGEIKNNHTTYRAKFDFNYKWKQFMFNANVAARESMLTNLNYIEKSFFKYGANIRWSSPRWMIELGTTNPFSNKNKTNRIYDSEIYSYNYRNHHLADQANGYIKIKFLFNKGKVENVGNSSVDRNINSAILKAE